VVYMASDTVEAQHEAGTGIGHNASHERLNAYFERIERLIEDRKGINDDIRDVLIEAKSEGFDVPAMRAVLRQRAMDPEKRMEQFALVDLYVTATGMGIVHAA